MHPEAWSWLEAQIRPALERAGTVLDIGGCDVNGSPRALFSPATRYVVMDSRPGPNVDLVLDAVKWIPQRQYRGAFDVTICTEVFEHVEHWRAILWNLWLTVRAGGICLITCATAPRPAHSIDGYVPPLASEWYANVPAAELLCAARLLFTEAETSGHSRGDLYLRAIR